jgi:ATP-dependent exoDNAse (exonuclease V) beta subunit
MAARRKGPDSQLGFDFGALPVPRNTPPPPPPPPPDSATPLERALRLESNLALFAGAGAGKTYSLITLCLHVLGGARAGHEPVPPANLCLLTFTDKAAAEMRQRLRERLDRLATGAAKGEHRELELETSFAALGRELPPKRFWRQVRDDLGAASIGTFHSIMTQVLRRAPAGSGVNPAFELLEDRDARALFAECVERIVLERLERDDPLVRELVRDFGFGADSPWGLVSALVRAAAAIREEGTRVELVPVQDVDEARDRKSVV